MLEIKRILCPVDFSAFSRHALSHAVALARSFDARVTVLHVFELVVVPDGLTVYPGSVVVPVPSGDQYVTEVEHFIAPMKDSGVPFDIAVEEGTPARQIVQKAAAIGADLIVMGTHGRGGFQHLILGSVTEKVLRKAPCPVLVVPPRVGGADVEHESSSGQPAA